MVGRQAVAAIIVAIAFGACARVGEPRSGEPRNDVARGATEHRHPRPAHEQNGEPEAARIDPRRGGFEISLGEWAVTPEAGAVMPGRVTFLIHNRGTMAHGFEIELEGDSSGHGSGELFKAESPLLDPGEDVRMTLRLAEPGIYEIECLVDGHDDMGMEGTLEVRADAPKLRVEESKPTTLRSSVSLTDFAFTPRTIAIKRGDAVTWSNDDPTPHTVTADDERFDSGVLDAGETFRRVFSKPGTYEYHCDIHPDMHGKVEVR